MVRAKRNTESNKIEKMDVDMNDVGEGAQGGDVQAGGGKSLIILSRCAGVEVIIYADRCS